MRMLTVYLFIFFLGQQVFSAENLSELDFRRIISISSADQLSNQYVFHVASSDGKIKIFKITEGDNNYKAYLRFIDDLVVGDNTFFRQIRILNSTAKDSHLADVVENKIKYFLEIPFATLKRDTPKDEFNNISQSDLIVHAFVHIYKKDWAKARFLHRLLEADRFSYTRGVSFSLGYNYEKTDTLFIEAIEEKLYNLYEKLTEDKGTSEAEKKRVQFELVSHYFSFKGLGMSSAANSFFDQVATNLNSEYKQMIARHNAAFLENLLDSDYSHDEIQLKARLAIDFFAMKNMKISFSYAKVISDIIDNHHTLVGSAIKLIQLAPPAEKKELLMSLLSRLYEKWQYTGVFSDHFEQIIKQLENYPDDLILAEYNNVRSHGEAISISRFVKEHFPTFELLLKKSALSCSKAFLN